MPLLNMETNNNKLDKPEIVNLANNLWEKLSFNGISSYQERVLLCECISLPKLFLLGYTLSYNKKREIEYILMLKHDNKKIILRYNNIEKLKIEFLKQILYEYSYYEINNYEFYILDKEFQKFI